MKRLALTLLVLAPVALTGCQTIREHNPFRHRSPPYQSAQQEQPLEVPPGMNTPPTTQALVIPSAASSAGAASAAAGAAATAQAVPAAPGGAGAPVPAGGAAVSMTLADTPQSVYHRVGLALARGDAGQVTGHDDTALTYEVAVDTVVTEKPQGGFLHRLFHHDKSEVVKGTVTVSVTPSGNGSLVAASGNPDAAARVMGILRERLK